MKSIDLGTVKVAISGVESVINEYPGVGELLKIGIISNSGVMSCTGSKLLFNPDYFGDKHTLAETCKDMFDIEDFGCQILLLNQLAPTKQHMLWNGH